MVARDPALQAQAYVDQGLDYYDEDRHQEALQCLERALQIDPEHGQAWYCRGAILGDLGEYHEAIKCYEHSAKLSPEHAHLPLFNMGNAHQELAQFDQALDCFRLATEANPEMADAWINRGRLLDDKGEHRAAIHCYDQALQIDAQDPMSWTNRGNSLAALEEYKQAGQSYQCALKIDPDDPIARLGVASCLAHLGEPQRALKLIDRIPEVLDSPPILVERATILVLLEQFDEALRTINRAIKLGADVPEAWSNRGEILAQLQQGEAAIESFDRALSLHARFAPALFGKARLLFHQDRPGEAASCLEQYFLAAESNEANYLAARSLGELCGLAAAADGNGASVVIPGQQLPSSQCPCCQAEVLAYCGTVLRADQEIGAYWMRLPLAHPGLDFLAIQLTTAGSVTPRVMVMQAQVSDAGITFWITDPDDTPWNDFGSAQVLSRDEGLLAPDREQFFSVADLINISDPRLLDLIRSSLDNE